MEIGQFFEMPTSVLRCFLYLQKKKPCFFLRCDILTSTWTNIITDKLVIYLFFFIIFSNEKSKKNIYIGVDKLVNKQLIYKYIYISLFVYDAYGAV